MDNREAARTIFAVAALLESLGANPFRVRAYRRAALRLMLLAEPAAQRANAAGELEVEWLGQRLRRKVGELVTRGRMQFYDELLDALPRPVRDLLSVPGIGPKTAARLMRDLNVRSLRGLVRAARRGQLQRLRGIGPVRERRFAEAAEAILAERSRPHRPPPTQAPTATPLEVPSLTPPASAPAAAA